ncbi:homeodomain interacting protein kinase [Sarotherodon galilaeus]
MHKVIELLPCYWQADLRPLKVSSWVCGGQKCQSCGFQRRAERLLQYVAGDCDADGHIRTLSVGTPVKTNLTERRPKVGNVAFINTVLAHNNPNIQKQEIK